MTCSKELDHFFWIFFSAKMDCWAFSFCLQFPTLKIYFLTYLIFKNITPCRRLSIVVSIKLQSSIVFIFHTNLKSPHRSFNTKCLRSTTQMIREDWKCPKFKDKQHFVLSYIYIWIFRPWQLIWSWLKHAVHYPLYELLWLRTNMASPQKQLLDQCVLITRYCYIIYFIIH